MNLIFTKFVRAWALGGEPTEEESDAAWRKLGDALRRKMQERSLWNASPSYLGVSGSDSWKDEDAFLELLCECYDFNFVRRLASLQALLEIHDNIEGVVFRNISNFLTDTQKLHDPIGYRVFQHVRVAIRQSIAAGVLHVRAGDARLDNSTILAFSPIGDLSSASFEKLIEPTHVCGGEVLPELVIGRGAEKDRAIERLRRCLEKFKAGGILFFRFKDLVDPLKQQAREWCWTLWRWEQGDLAAGEEKEPIQWTLPDSGFEEREAYRELVACVAEAIERLDIRQTARDYLEKLWMFLRIYVAESDSTSKRPALRYISERLNIPRYRLPELLKTLGRLVNECQRSRA